MKDFVITKKFDNLGRVVIPKDMRKHYGFKNNHIVQVIPQKNGILIVSNKTEEKKNGKDNNIQRDWKTLYSQESTPIPYGCYWFSASRCFTFRIHRPFFWSVGNWTSKNHIQNKNHQVNKSMPVAHKK